MSVEQMGFTGLTVHWHECQHGHRTEHEGSVRECPWSQIRGDWPCCGLRLDDLE